MGKRDICVGVIEFLLYVYMTVYFVGFSIVLVIWQLISLIFCPETPRYLLISKHDEDGAEKG